MHLSRLIVVRRFLLCVVQLTGENVCQERAAEFHLRGKSRMDHDKAFPPTSQATDAARGPVRGDTITAPKKATPKQTELFVMLMSGFVGVIITWAAIKYGPYLLPESMKAKPTLGEVIAIFFLLPVAFFVTIVVHELGHLIGALANGFRFRVLTLGPWSILSTNSGVRHRFSVSVMSMLGGQQISSPPVQGASDRQYVIYLLGGGVANIVTGAAALALVYTVALPAVLAFFLLFFAVFSLLLGPVNLLPITTAAGVSTDGYHIRSLRRAGAEASHFRAMFQLIADMYAGVRPREWRQDVVDSLAQGGATDYERMLGQMVLMQYAQDRGESDTANAAAEKVVEGYDTIPAAIRSQFAAELAYYYAVHRLDAAKARRYANDLNEDAYLVSASTLHRGRASAYFAEGDYNNAEVEVLAGLALVEEATTELDRVMERELLSEIRTKIAVVRNAPDVTR